MPRPTSFNEQRAEAIIAAIERVGFAHIAAEINGIHRETLFNWLARGDEGEEPFAAFTTRYREAHARWQEKRVERVMEDKWLLEKAEQRVFGQKQSIEHTGNLALELAELEGKSTDEIKQALRDVLKEGETT